MNQYIKQSTLTKIIVGPFLDIADGFSPLDALAVQAGWISKNGIGDGFSPFTWELDAYGSYAIQLTAEDTDTLGALRLSFSLPSTYLPVWESAVVLSQNVYDALVGGGDVIQVDLTQIGNNALVSATLQLKQLAISNSNGDAISVASTGANGNGIKVLGHGTGAGILTTGGGTAGDGIKYVAGAGGLPVNPAVDVSSLATSSDITNAVTSIKGVDGYSILGATVEITDQMAVLRNDVLGLSGWATSSDITSATSTITSAITTSESNIRGTDSDTLKTLSDEIGAAILSVQGADGYSVSDVADQVANLSMDTAGNILVQVLQSGDTVDEALSRIDDTVSSRAEPTDVVLYEDEPSS